MNADYIQKPGDNIKPEITCEEVKSVIKEFYNFKSVDLIVEQMSGYDDCNYKITVPNEVDAGSEKYVFKVLNSLDSKNTKFIEAMNSLMLFLNDEGFIVPKPIKTNDGIYYKTKQLRSGHHVIRLMIYIPGVTLYQVPKTSNKMFYEIGRYVAKLNEAMQNFEHDAYKTRENLWMLNAVPQLRNYLFAIDSKDKFDLITEIIDAFERRVLTRSKHFEIGMIHGDFNEQNVIIDVQNEKVDALLDFGDSQYNCYLYEIAITMTYMIILTKNLNTGGHVLGGYMSVRNIPEEEFALLKICIMARLAQSLVMGAYTITLNPNNDYVLTTAKTGWEVLKEIDAEPEEKLLDHWKNLSKEIYN